MIVFGPTISLPEPIAVLNKEDKHGNSTSRRSLAVEFVDFVRVMNRATGLPAQKIVEIAAGSADGTTLKEKFVASQAEREYLKKIGLDVLTIDPNGTVKKKWNEELQKLVKKGMTAAHAWDTLSRTQPELYEAFCVASKHP